MDSLKTKIKASKKSALNHDTRKDQVSGSKHGIQGDPLTTQSPAALNVLDLFCGVGGFSLGAARAGFNLVGAIDWDEHAIEMHHVNFPKTLHWKADITKLHGTDIQDKFHILPGSLDGIIGGPPCQGFSRMGHQRVDDTRNQLFTKFFSLVAELRPRFFLAENVLGILDAQNLPIVTEALESVSGMYKLLPPIIFKASEFGVPTTRTRVFFYGYLKGEIATITARKLKKLEDSPPVFVKDALCGLPEEVLSDWHSETNGWVKVDKPERSGYFYDRLQGHIPQDIGNTNAINKIQNENLVSGNIGTVHSGVVKKRYASLRPGEVDITSKSRRLEPDGFCHTIRAGTGSDKGSFQAVRPIHPTQARVITPREAARLQSFPDWFQFHPTKWHSFRQIGNSVCPILAEKILSIIACAINKENI